MADPISTENYSMQKWVAMVSVVLLIAKFSAYFFTGSVAVLSDAMESIVNVVAGLLSLYSLYIASLPRDMNHPYGHGKAEFLSSAVEGTLIGIAGLVILYAAIKNLIYPKPVKKLDIGMLIISATAIINYLVGWICVRKGKKNHSLALETSGRHLQTDTLSTIGVVIGLTLVYYTQVWWIDAWIAILLAGIILTTSYHLIRRSVAGIMDEADEQLLKEMIAYINNNRKPGWVDLHNLRVIKYGNVLHLDCHLTLPWYLNVREAHVEIDRLAHLIRRKYGNSLELFVHSDFCMDFQCPLCAKEDCPERKTAYLHTVPWTLENVVQNAKHGDHNHY